MSGNRSLDEFADAVAGEGADGDEDGDASDVDGAVEATVGAGSADAVDVEEAEEGVTEATVDGASGDAGLDADLESSGDDASGPASDDPETVGDSLNDPSTDVDADDVDEVLDADEGALDPPTSTYRWSPDGGDCAACGATVEERWRDGEDLVCAGCKEW